MKNKQLLLLNISLNLILFLAITGLSVKGLLLYRFLLPIPIVLVVLNRAYMVELSKRLLSARHFVFLLLWLGYAVIGLFWVKDIGLAVRSIYYLSLGIYLVGIFHINPKIIRSLITTVAVATVLIILFGVFEYITGYHLPVSLYWGTSIIRPTAVFHNPNDFAFFLSTYCWLFFAIANVAATRLVRIAGWLLFVTAIILVPLTGSRGALLALVAQVIILGSGVCLNFALSIFRKGWSRRLALQAITGFLVVLVVAASVVLVPSLAGSSKSIVPVFEMLFPRDGSVSFDVITNFFGRVRWNLVKNGVVMFRDSYFLGVGAGNAEAYMADYSLTRNSVGRLTNIHNWWVELAANYGLPGLLLYGMFLFYIIKKLIQAARRGGQAGVLGKVGIIMLAGFVFSAMSPSSIMSLRVHWIMYGLLGLLAQGNTVQTFENNSRGDSGGNI